MSPFLEHLSVPKGCQQAWPSAALKAAKALASVSLESAVLDRPYEENLVPAAVFRAAARSLVLLVLATPAERRETIPVGGPDKPVARYLRGDPRNKPAP